MLIRYAYGEEGVVFYEHNSNIIPRVGETIIFDDINYENCTREFTFVNNKRIYRDEYIIDNIDAELFTVTDVCYCICDEETFVDVSVRDYYDTDNDYIENLAKDVNVPNDFR